MSSSRNLTEIVARALELAPELRDAFLDDACRDQPDLRREADSLLKVAEQSGGVFESPVARIDVASPSQTEGESLQSGARLGPYEIIDEIGEGGMGIVYRARQTGPVERDVALKAIKPGMDTRMVLARFDLERRTLARLRHPNIATLLDAGATPKGRPYIVMELVEGAPITSFADEQGLSIDARIRLFLEALEAVRHAHRRGVLHRDLKASNVMVANVEGRPIVKVIDFGISKLLEQDETSLPLTLTGDGRSPGTPRSMAPEQLSHASAADVRTDVFALGVLLADLLTSESSHGRAPRELALSLPGDLRWVATRCLESTPEDRYQTVDDLIEDLNRVARNEPTVAGPPGIGRRIRSAWRRHRVPIVVAAIVLVSLSGGLVTALTARQEARAEAQRATAANAFLTDLFSRLDPAVARTRDTTILREMLNDAASRVGEELSDEPGAEAVARGAIGRGYTMIGEGALAEPHLRRAIELTPARTEQSRVDRRELRTRLMMVLKDLEHFDEAATIASEVHQELLDEFGETDPQSLIAANNLATVYMRQRRYAEAEPLLRSVLAPKEHSADVDQSSILITQSNLATTLSGLGRHEEALPLRETILAAVEREFGEDHPQTIIALNNVAVSLEQTRQDPDRIVTIRRRALTLAESIHGPRHPNTLTTRNNLAMVYAGRGLHQDAEPLFRESIEVLSETFGENHFMTIAVRKNHAESLLALDRSEEALVIAEAAWRGAVASLDADHPLQGLTLFTYTDALVATDMEGRALQVLETALAESQSNDGEIPSWHSDAVRRRTELIQSMDRDAAR